MTLRSLGFDAFFQDAIAPEERALLPGRIAFESRGIYHVLLDEGMQLNAELMGILRKGVRDRNEYPAVGDWVLVERVDDRRGRILRRLPRRNALVRREQSRRDLERRAGLLQVLAANVDWGLITSSLNEDFNPRRLERYLGLVRESQARPAILLTKVDLSDDNGAEAQAAVKAIAGDAPVILLSMPQRKKGLKELRALLDGHGTAVLIGSSGVGKSTLVNALLGRDEMATAEVREKDGRGRHTTVGRHLLALKGGGCLIDSPGLRELGLVEESSVDLSYEDIAALALRCKFNDCGHSNEPGCAVQTALADGDLDPERYDSYLKLKQETAAASLKRALGSETFQRLKGRTLGKTQAHAPRPGSQKR
jgi:ribosome biogenesis GTPase